MQICCDESGGKEKNSFIVSAVRGDAGEIVRAVKKMKRAARINGEMHGFQLEMWQIERIFGVLGNHPEALAVSVACGREDLVGGFAMGALEEPDLWGEMVTESCLPLYDARVRIIVPDRPRYKASVCEVIQARIAVDIARRTGLPPVPVSWADSQRSPGVQIADVISNTVWRSRQNVPEAPRCRQLLEEAQARGQVTVRLLELVERRPEWIGQILAMQEG